MSGSVQAMITAANNRTAAGRRQVFGKKATDQKVHENLCSTTQIYVDAFRKDPNSRDTRAAFMEMTRALTLSKRNLQA